MKFEMLSGDESLFAGAPDWATMLTKTGGVRFFVEEHKAGARIFDIYNRFEANITEQLMPYQFDGIEIIAERRPITESDVTEWNGEGLPPVGVECEFAHINRGEPIPPWERGVVRYLSSHTIVIELTGLKNGKAESISHPLRMRFRPTRSAEEIARDNAIGALEKAWEQVTEKPAFKFEAIYDAIAAGKIP